MRSRSRRTAVPGARVVARPAADLDSRAREVRARLVQYGPASTRESSTIALSGGHDGAMGLRLCRRALRASTGNELFTRRQPFVGDVEEDDMGKLELMTLARARPRGGHLHG